MDDAQFFLNNLSNIEIFMVMLSLKIKEKSFFWIEIHFHGLM
jgi:hypothetical protein